jgi:hypothetical protein
MFPLEPFTGWLRLCLDSDEKTVFLEDAVNSSPGTWQVELVLDPSDSPSRIFPFEPEDPLF